MKKQKKKKRRIGFKIFMWILFLGILGALVVAGINLYVVTSVKSNIITVKEAKDKKFDCIIVLGAGYKPDGTPSWMLEDRLKVGIQLYNEKGAAKILMSGDHGEANHDEVNIMKKYAIDKGIKSSDIFMDHAGFETYDTMYRAKKVFGAKKVLVVTQKYHLYRSLYIAKEMGLEAYGVSSDLRGYGSKQSLREVREWLARVKTFGKCIYKPEPKYLGKAIDLKGNGDITNDK